MGVPSDMEKFTLDNLDTGERHVGQFHAVNLRQEVSSEYGVLNSINRQHAIIQFLHGNPEPITFEAHYFQTDSTDTSVENSVAQLAQWVRRDSQLQRPPRLFFRAGDGHAAQSCVLRRADIAYQQPNTAGGMRHAIVSITLLQYEPFDIASEGVTDTRFHHAQHGDYYELLCWREYKNPLLGDVIRKRNPDKAVIAEGDVIALPAAEGLVASVITQTSIPLAGAYARQDTPQKLLKQLAFARNSSPRTSHVLVE